MKTRLGFVSNSSSQSFFIYGWTKETLKSGGITIEKIFEISEIEKANLDQFYIEYDDAIGLGNSEGDLHPDEDEEFDRDDVLVGKPTDEQVAIIDRLTKKYNLPEPEFMSGTFFNG